MTSPKDSCPVVLRGPHQDGQVWLQVSLWRHPFPRIPQDGLVLWGLCQVPRLADAFTFPGSFPRLLNP